MSIFDAVGKSVGSALATPPGETPPYVIVGPLESSAGPIPYYGVQYDAKAGKTAYTPSPFFTRFSLANAAQAFFAREPGAEVTSFAPGSADILRDFSKGYLPTVRLPDQVPARSEATGFAQQGGGPMVGNVDAGIPIAVAVIIGAVVVYALAKGVRGSR